LVLSEERLKEWVKRVSRLALIDISPDEEETLINDFKKIIEFFNKLQEVNVDNVEPLFMTPKEEPVVRYDEVGKCLRRDEFLSNVKERIDGYVKGPKII